MHTGNQVPFVKLETLLREALLEISCKGLGMTAIINDKMHILGIFTDGDLRRTLDNGANIYEIKIENVMTPSPCTATKFLLATEAAEIMERNRINALLIEDEDQRLIGALNMHDLLNARVL